MALARLLVGYLFLFQSLPLLGASVRLAWDRPASGIPAGYNIYRSSISGSGYVILNSQVIASCSYTDETALPGSSYYYIVTSISQCGSESPASNELAVLVPTPTTNNLPTADAGPDATVKSGVVVNLSGTGSDPDGDSLGFTWTQLAGPVVSLQNANTARATFVTPQVSALSDARFQLTVEDGRGGSASDDVRVTFRPKNLKPSANAGADLKVRSGETGTLQGSGIDPDGDTLTYSWKQISGPSISLTGTSLPTAGFKSPATNEAVTLGFQLSVADSEGETDSDWVNVRVRKNLPPTVSLEQRRPIRANKQATLTVKASDPDGDEVTISWSKVAGPDVTLFPSDRSVSFHLPSDAAGSQLTIRAVASDGLLTADANLQITVLPPPDPFVSPARFAVEDDAFTGAFIGIAVVNRGELPREMQVSMLGEDGRALIEQIPGPPLPAGGQSALITSTLPALEGDITSLLFNDPTGDLKGTAALGDRRLTRLEGIPSNSDPGRHLYFPLAPGGKGETGLISVFNGSDDVAEIRLALRDGTDGKVLGEAFRVLPQHGTFVDDSAKLFPDSEPAPYHYIEVDSSEPIRGYQVLADKATYCALAAQSAPRSSELWLPHFAVGSPDSKTMVRLLNTGTSALSVRLDAFADDGDQLGSQTFELQPGELLARSVEKLGPKMKNASGYIRLAASQADGLVPRLVAAAQFSGNNGTFATTVPFEEIGRAETLFAQIVQSASPAMFTGLAVLNPSKDLAQVQIRVFRSDGTMSRDLSVQLLPGARVADLLNGKKFFGESFEQVNGHLVVSSDVPVISVMLWGDYASTYLATVDGQGLD